MYFTVSALLLTVHSNSLIYKETSMLMFNLTLVQLVFNNFDDFADLGCKDNI